MNLVFFYSNGGNKYHKRNIVARDVINHVKRGRILKLCIGGFCIGLQRRTTINTSEFGVCHHPFTFILSKSTSTTMFSCWFLIFKRLGCGSNTDGVLYYIEITFSTLGYIFNRYKLKFSHSRQSYFIHSFVQTSNLYRHDSEKNSFYVVCLSGLIYCFRFIIASIDSADDIHVVWYRNSNNRMHVQFADIYSLRVVIMEDWHYKRSVEISTLWRRRQSWPEIYAGFKQI